MVWLSIQRLRGQSSQNLHNYNSACQAKRSLLLLLPNLEGRCATERLTKRKGEGYSPKIDLSDIV